MSKSLEELLNDRCNGIVDEEYEESFDVASDIDIDIDLEQSMLALPDTQSMLEPQSPPEPPPSMPLPLPPPLPEPPQSLPEPLPTPQPPTQSMPLPLPPQSMLLPPQSLPQLPEPNIQNTPIKNDLLLPILENDYHAAIAGLIYGCALGDNLGLQAEGKSLADLKTPVTGPPTKDYKGIDKNDWTDDTDQLILLMEAIGEAKGTTVNLKSFIASLIRWKKNGFRELDDACGKCIEPFTSHVIGMTNYTADPIKAALSAYKALGSDICTNGSLMRSGIIACCDDWQSSAIKQSVITHVDCRCLYASWLHIAICRSLLIGFVPNINDLLSNHKQFMKNKTNRVEFDKYMKIYLLPHNQMLSALKLDEEPISYVLKTIGVSFYALSCISNNIIKTHNDIKRELLAIINAAGDADTNAAVAGQILGTYVTYSNLPMDWINTLKHKQWLDRKIITFVKSLHV